MDEDDLPERKPVIEFALFALIAVLMLTDLVADSSGAAAGPVHVAIEAVIMIAAAAGALLLWGSVLAARRSVLATREEAQRWQLEARDALAGLGAAIERQFITWELTGAERAVGVLLLRGLSHKEVAAERQTSERTARQQALAVYRKASVRSRAELSAYFMRGLPLPGDPRATTPDP